MFHCLRGSGDSAEKAKTDAAGALARYFQMTVSANLSTTLQSVTSGGAAAEQTTVTDTVQVSSDVQLFALEYTEPYYAKKEARWYCVAYIEREKAWAQYQPTSVPQGTGKRAVVPRKTGVRAHP